LPAVMQRLPPLSSAMAFTLQGGQNKSTQQAAWGGNQHRQAHSTYQGPTPQCQQPGAQRIHPSKRQQCLHRVCKTPSSRAASSLNAAAACQEC
jgi:hypothetical protein